MRATNHLRAQPPRSAAGLGLRRLAFYVLAADLLWITVGLVLAFLLRYGLQADLPAIALQDLDGCILLLFGVAGGWLAISTSVRLDGFRDGWHMASIISRLATAMLVITALLLAVAYSSKILLSRLVISYFLVACFVGFVAIRLTAYAFLRLRRYQGATRNIVLVGNERIARELALKIARHPEMLCRVVGYLNPFRTSSPDTREAHPAPGHQSGLGSMDVLRMLLERRVSEVIVLLQHYPGIEFQDFLLRCRSHGIHVSVLPQAYELYLSRPDVVEIAGLPLIALDRPGMSPIGRVAKRLFDLAGLLVLAVPSVLLLAPCVLYLWRKKGQAFVTEVRCGEEEKEFGLLRLNVDRDPQPRTLEHWIQMLSISELPQLWNVLVGEMSLVGPRPESFDRVKHYSEWQRERLKTIPGMTGLAQVYGLREHSTSDEKTRYDLQYLLQWSPILDVMLLLQTAWALVARLAQPRHKVPAEAPAQPAVKTQAASGDAC